MIALSVYLLVVGPFFGARALWGVSRTHIMSPPGGATTQVRLVNRSPSTVLFDVYAEGGRRSSMLLSARERSHLHVTAGVGATVRVVVRPLSLESPGVERRSVSWTPEEDTVLRVLVLASGDASRSLEPLPEHASRMRSMVSVRSDHDLPVLLDFDVSEDGGGPIAFVDPERRVRGSWIGRGVWGATVSGIGVTPGKPSALGYTLPVATGHRAEYELTVPGEGTLEVAVGDNGRIQAGAPTFGDTLARWTGL